MVCRGVKNRVSFFLCLQDKFTNILTYHLHRHMQKARERSRVHSNLQTEYTLNFHVFQFILFKPQRSTYWKCLNSFDLNSSFYALPCQPTKYLEATHQDVENIPLQVAKWLHLKMRWRLRSQKHAEIIKGEWPEWPMMHWRRALSMCMLFF